MTVQLEDLGPHNWEEVADLAVADDQRGLIATNLYSIAESQFLPDFHTKAIVFGKDVVGFAMYGEDPDDGHAWLYRLMIDHRFQRRGFGRAALRLVICDVQQELRADVLRLGVVPENAVAKALYESAGFRPTGQSISGEEVLELRIETGCI
ncbi:GNAT family N-acetyltransferase (plasmid) [Prescottella equi]|uniref:GNAT family N-acetyltransferase n=1 Tax=Rhodococcus hoagii TaxID=43767 RepID=UPI002574C3EC|nr:GNAT family N-acetyltransferase [Prescottella equi]WJJ14564.1 GNAT family N-acetyltransferase [Prescottella equi]